jgi:outer membrane protein assembly factor BamB
VKGARLALLFAGWLAAAASMAAVPRTFRDLADPREVLPKAPHEVERRLALARQMLRGERRSEGVAALQGLLDEETEDRFVWSSDEKTPPRPLRQTARDLIGGLPAEGRAWYEMQFGPQARALLEAAAREGSRETLAKVARLYFHTQAGYEAAMLLARDHLDHGQPLEAIGWLAMIARSPAAREACEPECSVLLAVAWLLSGDEKRAAAALSGLGDRVPEARLRLGNREFALARRGQPDNTAELTRTLSVLIDGTLLAGEPRSDWPQVGGDGARNAEAAWSGALGRMRWSVKTLDPPELETLGPNCVNLRPALEPITTEQTVLARTPKQLFGLDAATGEIVWKFPWKTTVEEPRLAPAFGLPADRPGDLRLRLTRDAPYGQISTDGRRAYLIDGLAAVRGGRQSLALARRGALIVATGQANAAANRLVALDLRREGAMVWAVGGASGQDEPRLAGAFFLGSALPCGPRLFVLAELQGEILLCSLDADSGALEWSQAIARPQFSILEDPVRRLAGATPSLSGGVLVCPTSAGAIVAVDAATRSLLWALPYPQGTSTTRAGQPWLNDPRTLDQALEESQADSFATIDEGRVFVTPPDSRLLWCLDLFSGEELWSCRRDEMGSVACVHGGKVVLVGPRTITALDAAADGKRAWQVAIPSNARPVGRGLRRGSLYYQPTSVPAIVQIDLTSGRIVSETKADAPLGNLALLAGRLLIQSAGEVRGYEEAAEERKPAKD